MLYLSSFTFQYVSILILQRSSLKLIMYLFTFQYVSILINVDTFVDNVDNFDLHSNMFLF